jgi:hypothetical protein
MFRCVEVSSSAVQSEANDKENEFADDDKTTGADWESAIRFGLHLLAANLPAETPGAGDAQHRRIQRVLEIHNRGS